MLRNDEDKKKFKLIEIKAYRNTRCIWEGDLLLQHLESML
jgi:hypothetical protein